MGPRSHTPRRRPRPFLSSSLRITNSSILWPSFKAATSQRGCFPRPDQVSECSSGLRYFGRTRGYFRRSRRASLEDCESGRSNWRVSWSRRSCAKRFSSSRFSEVKRTDKTRLISSCSCHISSMDIASRLVDFLLIAFLDPAFVTTTLNIGDFGTFQHEYPKANCNAV